MRGLSQAQTTRIRYIRHQIGKIIYENQFGTIEEVQIDLRHKYFDSEKYDIPSSLFMTRDLSSDGPRFVFPWTDLSEGSNNLASYARSDAEFRDVVIEKGDRLFISRIDLVRPEERLRGCNIERRKVYFSIKRKGEDIVAIDSPLLLKPKNEILETGFTGNYYSAIKGRVKAHFKIDNANAIDHIEASDYFSYRALRKLRGLIRLWGHDGHEIDVKDDCVVIVPTCSSEEEYDKTNIWLTINDAVAMGYFWAKAEDQRNQARLEESAAKKSDAGRRSGDRREEHAEKWKQVFRARVEEIWTSATNKPTRTNLIEVILHDVEKWNATRQRLNLPDAATPGYESLRKEIPKVMRTIVRTEGKEGKERVQSPD